MQPRALKKLNAAFIYLLAMFVTGFTTKVVFTTHVIYRVQVVGMDALQLVLAGTALGSGRLLAPLHAADRLHTDPQGAAPRMVDNV
ncbi:MAG: hypothetical protein WEA61_10870 [Anaerolineales bacterium]